MYGHLIPAYCEPESCPPHIPSQGWIDAARDLGADLGEDLEYCHDCGALVEACECEENER